PRRRPRLLRDGPYRSELAWHARGEPLDPEAAQQLSAPALLRHGGGQREGPALPPGRGRERPRGAGQRLALRAVASLARHLGAGAQEPERGREGEDPLEEPRVAAGHRMTPERFARGMTFADYVKFTGSPENLGREGFDVRRFALVHPRLDWTRYLSER